MNEMPIRFGDQPLSETLDEVVQGAWDRYAMFDRSEGYLGDQRDEPRALSAGGSTSAMLMIRSYGLPLRTGSPASSLAEPAGVIELPGAGD